MLWSWPAVCSSSGEETEEAVVGDCHRTAVQGMDWDSIRMGYPFGYDGNVAAVGRDFGLGRERCLALRFRIIICTPWLQFL